jgi:ribosomal protein S18 acetylase RimI-like enzyme
MEHVLDNPAWNALISGNKQLSEGNEQVRYFHKDISPFAGLKEVSTNNFHLLHEQVPHNGPVIIITPQQIDIPSQWKQLQCIKGLQMICTHPAEPVDKVEQPVPLTNEHVPQMLELTKLTNPGPFASRTIDFGHYRGIFDNDRLIAMAGQRLHVFEYAEISAVCTHPNFLGRGYARQLLLYHLHRIIAALGVPFLHVRNDNERAIKLYKSLGFFTRQEIYFYILYKK